MSQKVVIIADPGIDTAFAIALALRDPNIDVLGLIACAGNVDAEHATQNVHTLINQIDCPRWPRIGAALPVEYEIDGTKLHGPGGLGGVSFPAISLHQPTPGDKLLVELAHTYPKELTVIVLGPATVLARAFDRDPELPKLLESITMMGGTWHRAWQRHGNGGISLLLRSRRSAGCCTAARRFDSFPSMSRANWFFRQRTCSNCRPPIRSRVDSSGKLFPSEFAPAQTSTELRAFT